MVLCVGKIQKRLILLNVMVLLMFYANKCLILFSFCKLTTFWLKGTLKYTWELEKLIYFQFFHVGNSKIQSMLWFYVSFNVEIRVIWVKNKLFLRFMYVFYEIIRFFGYNSVILSKLLMFYANKCWILLSVCKLNTFWLKRTLKCTWELEKLIYFHFFT